MQPAYQSNQPITTLVTVEQQKVMQDTKRMLGITLIPTVIGAWMGTTMNFTFIAQHPLMAPLLMLGALFGLFMAISANRNNQLGVVLLLVATFLLGLMLGPILQFALHLANGAQLIGMAAGGTGVILLTLSTIATVSKRDFSFLGQFLFVGLIMLILASIANLFFHIPALSLAVSAVAILLFSGYLLMDVSRVINGGETSYILATLKIYLDVYNIFVNLLNLLIMLTGNSRR